MTTPTPTPNPRQTPRPGRSPNGTPSPRTSPVDLSRSIIQAAAVRHCTPRDLARLVAAYRRVQGVAQAAYKRAGDLARADLRYGRDTTAHDADAQILGALAAAARFNADTLAVALADAREGEDIRDA